MSKNLKLKIADIIFLIISEDGICQVKDNTSYRLFLTDGRPDVILRFQYGSDFQRDMNLPGKILFDTYPNWRLYYSDKKYFLEIRNCTSVLTSDFTSGDVYIAKNCSLPPFSYPLDEILMINLLGRKRGILVHACGVKNNNGGGLLFAGTSGAGKSTMANLWGSDKEVTILNDDRVIIRKKNARFWVYGTPWHGDVKVCSPEKAPLEKIFFLKHARENKIKEIDRIEAISCLIAYSFTPLWDKKGMNFTLEFCSEIAEKIPCYELGFVPDESILDLIERH